MKYLVAFAITYNTVFTLSSIVLECESGVTERVLEEWRNEIRKEYANLNKLTVRVISFQKLEAE